MYDIIYDFIYGYIFNSQYLANLNYTWFGSSLNLNQILTHFTCVFLMGLFIFLLVLLLRWIFRLVSGLFLLR